MVPAEEGGRTMSIQIASAEPARPPVPPRTPKAPTSLKALLRETRKAWKESLAADDAAEKVEFKARRRGTTDPAAPMLKRIAAKKQAAFDRLEEQFVNAPAMTLADFDAKLDYIAECLKYRDMTAEKVVPGLRRDLKQMTGTKR